MAFPLGKRPQQVAMPVAGTTLRANPAHVSAVLTARLRPLCGCISGD
jgi:hypothetical protein